MIDTLAIYKQLTAAGIKLKHAEAITQAIFLAHKVRLNDLQNNKEAEVGTGFSREAKCLHCQA
jgi:hypothetical protein